MAKNETTLRQIARKLNISVSTASKALHDHPGISLGTKIRVLQLVNEFNYDPSTGSDTGKNEKLSPKSK